jgi:hypothetical protein
MAYGVRANERQQATQCSVVQASVGHGLAYWIDDVRLKGGLYAINLREAIGLSLRSDDDLVQRCGDGVASIVGNVEQTLTKRR